MVMILMVLASGSKSPERARTLCGKPFVFKARAHFSMTACRRHTMAMSPQAWPSWWALASNSAIFECFVSQAG
jgi:hypothetical protein